MSKSMQKKGTKVLDLPSGYRATSFVRMRENGSISKAVVDGGLNWEFKFNDIPDYTDFTNLYDGYIIDRVDIHFTHRAESVSGFGNHFATLFIAPDYDGATLPGLPAEVTTKERCVAKQLSTFNADFSFPVQPRVSNAVYKGLTSGYGWAPSNQIIDMNNVDVPHYGAVHWLAHYNSTDTPGSLVGSYLVYHFRCIGQR